MDMIGIAVACMLGIVMAGCLYIYWIFIATILSTHCSDDDISVECLVRQMEMEQEEGLWTLW